MAARVVSYIELEGDVRLYEVWFSDSYMILNLITNLYHG